MPRSKEFLLEQIARAKRFALAMNTDADRERFEKMAADLQSELEGAEAAQGEPSAGPTTASEDAAPTNDVAAGRHQSGGPDATAPTSGSDDQEPNSN